MNQQHEDTLNRIASLDAGINNPARLMIVFLLSRTEALDYNRVLARTRLTSGNLTTHLIKLEELGYIKLNKSFINRKPHTLIQITTSGREAYLNWGESVSHALPEEIKARQRPPLYWPLGLLKRYPLSLREWSFALPDNRGFASLPDGFLSFDLPPIPGTEMIL